MAVEAIRHNRGLASKEDLNTMPTSQHVRAIGGGSEPAGVEAGASRKPQWLILCFAGTHMLKRPAAELRLSDLLGLMEELGVNERTSRSTIARMERRGLLYRRRVGRSSYFGMSPYGRAVLRNGDARVRRGALVSIDGSIGRKWDGQWTSVGFSLPKSRRGDRLLLISRLTWAGFGRLQDGLWIAADEVDVDMLTKNLDIDEHVHAFRAQMIGRVDVKKIVARVWDLSAVALRYAQFIARWEGHDASMLADVSVAPHLSMLADWLFAVRGDPRLPIEYLPADWPAIRAHELFQRLQKGLGPGARRLVSSRFEWREGTFDMGSAAEWTDEAAMLGNDEPVVP